jgi:hypothetical protein
MWILYEYSLWGMGLTSQVQRPHNTPLRYWAKYSHIVYVKRRRHITGLVEGYFMLLPARKYHIFFVNRTKIYYCKQSVHSQPDARGALDQW